MVNDSANPAAPCPVCGEAIAVRNGHWKCPCCSSETDSWDALAICSTCRFPPFYYPCPHCASEFPIHLLFGDEPGSPRTRPEFGDRGHRYKLTDLRLFQSPHMVQDAAWASAIEAITPNIDLVEFAFPCEIKSHMLLGGGSSSDARSWLHFFLYNDEDANEEARVGQVSVVGSKAIPNPAVAALLAFPNVANFVY